MKPFEGFDLNLSLFWAVQNLRNPYLDWFFTHLYLLGKGWVLLPLAVWVYLYRRKDFALFLLTVGIETFLVQIMKRVFDQPRPGSFFENFTPLEPVYHHSFPSGDTAMTFAVAAFLWKRVSSFWRAILLVYAFLIGFGRVYLGAHFPLDVLAGALIGLFSYLVAERLLKVRKGKG